MNVDLTLLVSIVQREVEEAKRDGRWRALTKPYIAANSAVHTQRWRDRRTTKPHLVATVAA